MKYCYRIEAPDGISSLALLLPPKALLRCQTLHVFICNSKAVLGAHGSRGGPGANALPGAQESQTPPSRSFNCPGHPEIMRTPNRTGHSLKSLQFHHPDLCRLLPHALPSSQWEASGNTGCASFKTYGKAGGQVGEREGERNRGKHPRSGLGIPLGRAGGEVGSGGCAQAPALRLSCPETLLCPLGVLTAHVGISFIFCIALRGKIDIV